MRTFLTITLITIACVLFAPGLLSSVIGGLLAITISGIIGLALVGFVMLIVGLVFGSTLLALAAGAVTLLLVGFSVFWPLLLIFFIIWLCTRSSRSEMV